MILLLFQGDFSINERNIEEKMELYIKYFNYDNHYLAFNTFMQDGGMSGSYLYEELVDKNNYCKTKL